MRIHKTQLFVVLVLIEIVKSLETSEWSKVAVLRRLIDWIKMHS